MGTSLPPTDGGAWYCCNTRVCSGTGPFLVLDNLDQPGDVKRLGVMEYDFRPHEAYDVAIAALFIVFMLTVIALIFVLY